MVSSQLEHNQQIRRENSKYDKKLNLQKLARMRRKSKVILRMCVY